MKQCPRCNQTYTDDQLNFCLNDGEMLVNSYAGQRPFDDSPPTVMMNDPRATNPTNWQAPAAPPAQWQNPQKMQATPFGSSMMYQSKDKTLPTISLVLGILSIVLVCCYGGIWLGIPAAVIGFLGMKNADSDPSRYEGRGLAIAGMVIGGVSLLASFVFVVFAILAR